jgi:putative MATE family efflux protein
MQDLTTGPITKHLLKTTSFMLVMMVFQTLYFLIDLYWVGRLGTTSVAAVGIAGNLSFVVLAITQMLGVGTSTVIAHATGRKDRDAAIHLFNQSNVLACVAGSVFLVLGIALRGIYTAAQSADAETAKLANDYLDWFIPAMALQFPLASMGAALRGVGDFRTGMVVGTGTVVLNLILAPFLIFGWVTGHAFGVGGAALSTLVAVVAGLAWMIPHFTKHEAYLRFHPTDWRPRQQAWTRMLGIGLPAGFEFAMVAVYIGLVYAVTRPFGAAAQAGFGIGQRVIQAGFMPVVALAFSVAPVAGQNFGARLAGRVKATYRDAVIMVTIVMALFALASHIAPEWMIRLFTKDEVVVTVGVEYLRIISWNYVASGIIFVNSSMFQAMGNTMPSLLTSGIRMLLVAVPVVILSRLPGFELRSIWYLSAAAVIAQLALSLWLLRREFRLRLAVPNPASLPLDAGGPTTVQ